ncbi:hypothetical protein Trydic_g18076 [Trypoxylus dichotomus]
MGDNACRIVCYTDDIILIVELEDDVQCLLHEFSKAAGMLNIEISVDKTKSTVIFKEPVRCKLVVYNKGIEQTMIFNYLSVEISTKKKHYSACTLEYLQYHLEKQVYVHQR